MYSETPKFYDQMIQFTTAKMKTEENSKLSEKSNKKINGYEALK